MSSFEKKKISRGQVLGEKLYNMRLEQGLSLQELKEQTGIPQKYLEILESGNYQKLPGDIYAKAWIKKYAAVLGFDPRELLVDYKLEKRISENIHNTNQIFSHQSNKRSWQFLLTPRMLKIAAMIFVALGFFSYLGWEVKNIINPPKIEIFAPANYHRTTDSNIEIVGQTEPEVQLLINGEQVLLDDNGSFHQTINLAVGLNKLEINAKKKHSKVNTLELDILREAIE